MYIVRRIGRSRLVVQVVLLVSVLVVIGLTGGAAFAIAQHVLQTAQPGWQPKPQASMTVIYVPVLPSLTPPKSPRLARSASPSPKTSKSAKPPVIATNPSTAASVAPSPSASPPPLAEPSTSPPADPGQGGQTP